MTEEYQEILIRLVATKTLKIISVSRGSQLWDILFKFDYI
jgi:hypothetical protein